MHHVENSSLSGLTACAKIPEYASHMRAMSFKFILDRPELQSDILSVTLDVTLNGTEMAAPAILKQKPGSSRYKIPGRISTTDRTGRRVLDLLSRVYMIRKISLHKKNPG